MKRMSILGLALVAMFAMSAIAATAAMATTTDEYQIELKKLEANETREIKASAKSEFTLKGKGALNIEAVTKCKKLKLDAADHPFVAGGTPGTSGNEAIEFEECKGTVGGAECTGGVEIESAKTTNELVEVAAPSGKAGDLAVLFKPVSGTTFSKEKLNKCGAFGSQSATVEGSTAAIASTELAVKGTLAWNEKEEVTEIKKLNGTKEKVGLTSDKKAATLNGESFVELVSGASWCAL
jgi:hypothetical protein